MSGISLTAPMRSTLLALQNIARQQDIVQNRLATGLKVSSAIDNPSSYYTAASLSNRAADLSALLDAMSQGVQTIKTASEAITSATKFLEQAKATANQALENKEYQAVVRNEKELLEALNSGLPGKILIDGNITLSENQTLTLANGQSLYGTNGSGLNFTINAAENMGCINITGVSEISNLNIAITTDKATTFGINCDGGNLTAANLNFRLNVTDSKAAINTFRFSKASSIISGQINIKGNGPSIRAISANNGTTVTISAGTLFNQIIDGGQNSRGFEINSNSVLNIEKKAVINMNIGDARAVYARNNSVINIDSALLNLTSGGNNFIGLETFLGGKINLSGNTLVNIAASGSNSKGIAGLESGDNLITIGGDTQINISMSGGNSFALYTDKDSIIDILSGAIISINNGDTANDGIWQADSDYRQFSADGNVIGLNSLNNASAFAGLTAELPPPVTVNDIDFSKISWDKTYSPQNKKNSLFNSIIEQYDTLISDASYKGINLLTGQNLKINFNEDRSSKLEVPGISILSDDLKITPVLWEDNAEIEQSVSELEGAINTLRNYASQYGNYYSIVTTRQDFTENLINVLEEGADKLTLADMNEESANMLALQTSQQLAINSLSLASQAAQSVLKLF